MTGGSAGDFDGDGFADAWLAKVPYSSTTADTITVYLGDSSGTWTTKAYTNTEGQIGSPASGDFDGDGYTDLVSQVIPSSGSSTAVLLEGSAAPASRSFTAAADGWLTASSITSLTTMGDVTGDGYDDVGVTVSSTLYVFDGPLGTGMTTGSAYASSATGECILADTDDDGVNELFVGPSSSYIQKYPTPLPSGSFGTSEATIYADSGGLAAGDLTDDGYDDLAFTYYGDIYLLTGGEW